MTRFAELAVTTNFSFLRGGSHPEELVREAARLGLAGIAVADRNTLAGIVRGHVAAKEAGFRYAVGCRLAFRDTPPTAPKPAPKESLTLVKPSLPERTPDVLAWPTTRAAYGRLCRLLTLGNRRAEKGECHLDLADLLEWGSGMVLGVMPGERPDAALAATLSALKDAFPGNVRLMANRRHGAGDQRRLAILARIARRLGVPLLATNDVLYHALERRPLQDVLTSIREHVTLQNAGKRLEANAERHLKDAAEMARLFRDHSPAIAESEAVLERLGFSLDELQYQYPDEPTGAAASPQEALIKLTEAGARFRYPGGVPEKVGATIAHELELIESRGYAPYFLTVYDIVRFAREKEILCQGRGSAANSAICFCLGITEVDPDKSELLFERFISPERNEPPDIDVDFEHERREEVIQYVYDKYGRHRAGIAATVISYRTRSAVREVGKAFGLSDDAIGALASTTWGWSSEGVRDADARRAGLDPTERTMARVLKLSEELIGFPRHLSQHVGGFVMTRDRLDEMVPVMNAAMDERTHVEWDKDDLDALHMLKVDVLALGMLSCIRRAFEFMAKHYGDRRTLATIPAEDPAVYRMLKRADSLGVFQVESRAQMTMLPRLKPEKFYDLVIEVAIVRPGPIQGDMVHPYLRRRQGIEPVHYPSPSPVHGDKDELKNVLERTLGVPLFQEQAMKIAMVAAKFTAAEADKLRRAMATFKRVGTIGTFQTKMIEGMVARGYDREFAEHCFHQIEGFGEYGFPESHAASFALLVYASAWIKCHYPDVFCSALLNAQPMGFYAPAQIVRDAERHGVTVLPVDVNFSDWDTTLSRGEKRAHAAERSSLSVEQPRSRRGRDDPYQGHTPADRIHPANADMAGDILSTHAVRLGLRQIKGFSEDDAERLVQGRGRGYDSVRDLWLRSGLGRAAIERLADADAFRSIGLDRRDALWAARELGGGSSAPGGRNGRLPLFDLPEQADIRREPDFALPQMPIGEHVVNDYRFLSLSLKAHPVSFLRERLGRKGIIASEMLRDVPNGRRVTVAGLVLVRQRPGSASGVIFMTLEDETDIANAVVWPKVFERFRPVVLGARLTAVSGPVQKESGVIHVVAERLIDLTPMLAALSADAHDLEALARADEVRRPGNDQRDRRSPSSRLVRLAREDPALVRDMAAGNGSDQPKPANRHPRNVRFFEEKPDPLRHRVEAAAMPKGRNFH
jgi:error-prone DNA polymerase